MEDYDKMAIVGRGAFGTVYLCRKDSGERVVLKQIVIEHLNGKELEETTQEVKVMSLLKHPHVIKYYDSFISSGALVIVMEYATKGTLHEYLQHQKQLLPQQIILNFFAQMCMALEYIHKQKILHRDITTRNILLTGTHGQIIKLTDFGISKILTSRNKTSSVVGTPCYLSPELCEGKAYGTHSDVWALGCVLYNLCTLKQAFQARTSSVVGIPCYLSPELCEGKAYGTHSDVWALGCVLYNLCTLKQAFQARTLAALVMKIMHGAIEEISESYESGMMEILSLMLDRDPLNRPGVNAILSHRLVAPVVYHIITSLGSLVKSDHDSFDQEHKPQFHWANS